MPGLGLHKIMMIHDAQRGLGGNPWIFSELGTLLGRKGDQDVNEYGLGLPVQSRSPFPYSTDHLPQPRSRST